mgnify:CR=1 FL=1
MTQNHGDQASAHAPYNFIPLSDSVIDGRSTFENGELPSLGVYDPNLHHGYFDVTLTTETPLYIRGMRKSDQDREQHKNDPEFFHVENENDPVIPGSSLRGMLRSLFEIVTFSKMDRVSAQRLFFRTVDDTAIGKHYRSRMVGQENGERKVEAGFLHHKGDEWEIIKCDYALVHHEKLVGNEVGLELFTGKKPNLIPKWDGAWHQYRDVWVTLSDNRRFVSDIQTAMPAIDPSYKKAIFVMSGHIDKTNRETRKYEGKKHEFVFLLPESEQQYEFVKVSDEKIKRFHDEDQITRWQQEAFAVDKPGKESRDKKGWLQRNPSIPGEPVFYLVENGELTFFGRAQMFRLPYRTSPHDLIPNAHTDTDVIDMTEAVFGFVRQKKAMDGTAQARAGRVFVTDARLIDGQTDVLDEKGAITPPILSSPKPTTFQHYLDQTGSTGKDNRKHYDTPRAKLRGQKLYWRQRVKDLEKLPGAKRNAPTDKATQLTRLRAVNPQKRFHFRVEFENLNRIELGALAWVLTLSGMGDEARHMLGMGKPFGMGVVHLETHLILRNPVTRYSALFDGDGWATGDSEAYDAALPDVIEPFTQYVSEYVGLNFADHERILSLAVMLKLRDPLTDFFGYMQVERPRLDERGQQIVINGRPQTDNEYKERPILPTPQDVDKAYRRLQYEAEQQRRASRPVEVGKRVSGNLKNSDEDYLWFEITSGRTENPHLAAVPPAKITINNGMVKNVIVEAIEKDGGTTYYWCRRENEAEREERKARRN